MLWGVMDTWGNMHNAAIPVTVRSAPLPGRFDAAGLTLDLAEERFELRPAGRLKFGLRDRERAWGSGAWRIILPALSGEAFVSDSVVLLISGGTDTMGPRARGFVAAAQRALREPATRVFLLLRRSELKGWRRKGRRADVFCLSLSEPWLVPDTKRTLRVQADPQVEGALLSGVPEAPDPGALDAQHDLGLPRRPPATFRLLTVLALSCVGIFGMFGSLIVALLFRPGSPAAIASVAVGMVFLFGSFLSLPIFAAVARRRDRGTASRWWGGVEDRSRQRFLEVQPRLAQEFAAAGVRRGIPLDFTPQSLARLPELEASLSPDWLASTYRYGAYLGEVFARDVRHRMHAEWIVGDGGLSLSLPEARLVFGVMAYAEGRARRREAVPPVEKYRDWAGMAFLAEAAQPLNVFTALGIRAGAIEQTPKALRELAASLADVPGERVVRPFGSFLVRRKAVGPGIALQENVLLREEAGGTFEEVRCFRPVFEPERTRACVVMDTFELGCGAEAVVLADFGGGTPGQPLVFPFLTTDYLAQPPEALGPGQPRSVAVGGIGLRGEFVPPAPGTDPRAASRAGHVRPANPAEPVSPRTRVAGLVEAVRSLSLPSEGATLVVFDLDVQGVVVPIASEVSRLRGTPRAGDGFTGEVWFQGRVGPAGRSPADASVR